MTEYFSAFSEENLTYENYFQTFCAESFRCGLITEARLASIQNDTMRIISEKIRRYCGEELNSVSYEEADSISASVFFALALYLRSFESVRAAIPHFLKESVDTMYNEGRRKLSHKLSAARLTHSLTVKCLADTGNYAYTSTALAGISAFFKKYDEELFARENIISGDYPAVGDWQGKFGAEFIERYSAAILRENSFLLLYPGGTVRRLLSSFDKAGELIYNISDCVFANTAGRVMLAKGIYDLSITESDAERLLSSDLPSADRLTRVVCAALHVRKHSDEEFFRILAGRFLKTADSAAGKASLVFTLTK